MPSRRFPVARPRLWPLLAAVLLFKALVPSGWMPVAANGMVELQLCGGRLPVAAESLSQAQRDVLAAQGHQGDAADGGQPDDGQQAPDPPCSFALAGFAWPPVETQADFVPRSGDVALGAGIAAVAIGQGLAAPPPPSTGPPSLA